MGRHAVTGVFGFSGKYVAEALLNKGETVIGLTNSPNRSSSLHDRVETFPYNFDNIDALTESLKGVDVLYNNYWVRFNHPTFSHAQAVENAGVLFEAARRAGVGRIVQVSITSADENSPFEYFRGKGVMENMLKATGLPYSIVRPALLYGPGDILVNNIAWALRRFPVFAVFGDGRYHVQPVLVTDHAALVVAEGLETDNRVVDSVGPEDFMYIDMVKMIRDALGLTRPVIGVPPGLGYLASRAIGKVVGDVFVTRAEIDGLMADTLHAPGAPTIGDIAMSEWVREHREALGKVYSGELPRRLDRTLAH